MNLPTYILVPIVIAVIVLGILAAGTNNVVSQAVDVVMGSEDSKGIVECDPTDPQKDCPVDEPESDDSEENTGGGG